MFTALKKETPLTRKWPNDEEKKRRHSGAPIPSPMTEPNTSCVWPLAPGPGPFILAFEVRKTDMIPLQPGVTHGVSHSFSELRSLCGSGGQCSTQRETVLFVAAWTRRFPAQLALRATTHCGESDKPFFNALLHFFCWSKRSGGCNPDAGAQCQDGSGRHFGHWKSPTWHSALPSACFLP